MFEIDYNNVEMRVIADMIDNLDTLPFILDHGALRKFSKHIAYSVCYSGFKAVQERIDEEGCGAVMCAAKLHFHKDRL